MLTREVLAALCPRPRSSQEKAAIWDGYIEALTSDEGAALLDKFGINTNLRAALPFIQGNNAMLATTYFYLGVANYQLGKTAKSKAQITEASKFSEQSAAIASPVQQSAARNAAAMKAEAAKMR